MAEIIRYVDTGSDAAGDGTTSATSSGDNTHAYQSLFAWDVAEQTNLDTANNTHTVHCNRTNGGGEDTTMVTINGWITSATDFITITQDDFPADGVFDGTKYVLHNNDTDAQTLLIQDDHVRVIDFQIKVTETGANTRIGIMVSGIAGGNYIVLDSVFVKGVCSGTGISYGIRVNDSSTLLDIYNCIVTGFKSGADTDFIGIYVDNCTTANIFNTDVYGCYYGVQRDMGTANVINGLIFNNDDDINGTVTVTYSALDDVQAGTGNFQITQSADDYAALVVDAAGDDFHVTDTSSELYQTGNGATPKAIFTDDIIGTSRPQAPGSVDLDWDIGAYELIAAAVGNAGIMTTNTGYWGPTF